MMPVDFISGFCRPAKYVGRCAVVTQHVHVCGCYIQSPSQFVLRDVHRFQKNFGQNDRAAGIDPDAAVEVGDNRAENPEVGVGSRPERRGVYNPVHVHDLHATLLRLMGFDHKRLTYRYAGRDFRLTDVHGNVIDQLIS